MTTVPIARPLRGRLRRRERTVDLLTGPTQYYIVVGNTAGRNFRSYGVLPTRPSPRVARRVSILSRRNLIPYCSNSVH